MARQKRSVKYMRSAIPALIALAGCAAAPEPQSMPAPPSPAAMERGPPLQLDLLDIALGPDTGNDGGMRAQYLSMLGREDLMPVDPPARACPPLMRDGASVDPFDEIARRAEGFHVVIVNEDHSVPQHRAFIARVAAALSAEGFNIYAAETFMPPVREERAWPSIRDGFYSIEPVFGAGLRRARALGYRLIEYEHFPTDDGLTADESIAVRETGQARNLQRILEETPQARMLVHVGFAHLLETPDRGGRVWMAQRLKEATGIDPLTIDLTGYASATEDFVFCDPAQTTSRSVDIRIGAPVVTFEQGRPAWRIRAGQQPTPIPTALLHSDENTIAEARLAAEPDDAVPVDRILMRPGEILPLLLPPGRYRVDSWTQTRGWSSPVEVEVQ